MNPPVTQTELKSLLRFDPETGQFYWLRRHNGRIRPDLLAGTKTHRGYIHIRVAGKNVQAHRLAWLYMTGEWPAHQIDHADCDGTNNRWSNLRAADAVKNAANTPLKASNSSGIKGVSFNKARGRWTAHIRAEGKKRYLGLFNCAEDAKAAYERAALKTHGEFART